MKKSLGLTSIICISTGAMISSGLFILPGLAFAKSGPSVFISYFLAGLAALTTVLSLSELMTAMPKAGGDYYYVSRSFGQLFGTVSGLLSWLALSLKSAFAVIGIAELLYLTFGGSLILYAFVLTVIFTAINLFGVKEAVNFQIILVIILVLILGSFFIVSLKTIHIPHFDPLFPKGINSLFTTAGFVFVAFGGVLTTASIAGEIKNPSRNIPLGLIISVIAVTLLYASVIFGVVGTVPSKELSQSLAPIALAGKTIGGDVFYYIIMTASLLAFITTVNGGIITASRYPIALSADRMLPDFFSRISQKNKTPYTAVIATGIIIAVSITLKLDLLIKAASTVILLSNIFAHLSVIAMRESTITTYRPTYHAPFYPWLQLFGILIFTLLIIDMGIKPVLLSLVFTSAGILLYFWRRGNIDRMSPALIHVIERITNKEIVTHGLDKELREIVEDRDNIVRDEFDNAIENSHLIEIYEQTTIDDLWDLAAHNLHEYLPTHIPTEKLVKLLKEREAESSTAISNFIAIPHVIIEGKNIFNIVLLRAHEGVSFDENHSCIKAVFILIGTKDMRNLHLRALAAIAQIVQHSGFESEWLKAKNHRELQDLFLLSKRRRSHD